MRISDWSSDVCSSDLPLRELPRQPRGQRVPWRANASDWGRMHHAALAAVARLEIAQLQAGARQPAWLFEMPMRGRGGLDVLQLRICPEPVSAQGDRAWIDRKSPRLNSSHSCAIRMTSPA